MSLGIQIQKYRIGAGLTFAELADLAGVEIGTINALEKRKSKRSEHGPALARALGLSIEQLLDIDTDYTARIRSHLQRRLDPPELAREAKARNNLTAPWATSSPWPFPHISPQRFRATLSEADIARVESYALAIIEMHEAEGKKNVG